MTVTYKDCRDFSPGMLDKLFLSVKWASGAYPHRLARALSHFDAVYSAWWEEELVGLAAAMDDGEMNAYIHYVLVQPEYQDMGIGTALMEKMLQHYKNYLRIALIAVNEQIDFYSHLGFTTANDKTPMFLTSLWN